jgi:hypothetical protein
MIPGAIPLALGFDSLAGATAELLGDWQAMLRHHLPVSPPFETCWNVLTEFFAWLESTAALPALAPAPLGAEEEVFRQPVGLLRRQGVLGSSFLEIIRLAAVNRLCVGPVAFCEGNGMPQAARAEDAGANPAPPKALRLTAR